MAANNYGIQFVGASLDRIDFSGTALGASIKDKSAFTLEAWIKVGSTATSPTQRFYIERQNAGKLPRLAATAWNDTTKGVGKLRFEFARVDNTSDTNYTYTRTSLWDDYWHHVAFTVDIGPKDYKIYVDGALVAQGKITDGGLDGSSNPLKVSNTAPASLVFGAFHDGTNYTYWDGKIDCVRVWGAVRSQTAIQDNRLDHLANPSGETNLLEEWRLNEGSGTSTAGAKNGTWTGTLKRNGASSAVLWNIDRPFMGDGNTDSTPPPNPTANAPASITTTGFTYSWSSVSDDVYTQYYELMVATDSAFISPVGVFTPLNVGRVTTYNVTGLNPNTNYYARVRAVDAATNASSWVTYNSNAVITTSALGDVTAPSTPVATSATSVTSTTFTANWNAATDNTAVTGYKLDVATDTAFTSFAAGWRNLDVGNVLTKVVNTALDPSTTYYYRVRAYDAAQNESADSNTITVTTSAPPDTTPPDTVVLHPATSITSSSFTANWNVGIDDVGVVSYRLDVARDSVFTQMVSGYNNLNVGNVLTYGVSGLADNTGYYYRVRAVDAASNTSSNTATPETVTTLPTNVGEGGLVQVGFDPIDDTYIRENAATTNFGTATSMTVDGDVAAVHRAYLKFDISSVVGTIVNANLRLYVSNGSVGTVSAQRATGTWDEDVLTWSNNTLVLTGSTVDFIPNVTNQWVEVDIASILTVGAATYTIAVLTTSTDGLVFDSKEGTNVPQLVLEVDPSTATEIQTMTAAASNTSVTNLLKNPSAETGGTAFGGSTGITLLTTATLLQDNTQVYDGTYACKVVTAASIGSGVKFESNTALAIAGTGQTVNGHFYVYANSTMTLNAKLRLLYTDVTQTDGTVVTVVAGTDWRRYDVSAVATNGKTIDKVEIHLYTPSASALTYWADAALVANATHELGYFDGTDLDSSWNGTAHASSSLYNGATLVATSTYVGDGDGDNTVVAQYKRSIATDWLSIPSLTATNNRGAKTATATVGPIYRANHIHNPSFTNNSTWWASNASGTTLTRITTDGMEEAGAADLACLQVVGDGVSANQGTFAGQNIVAAQNDVWTLSFYVKSVSGATTIRLKIDEKDSTGAVLVSGTQDVTITTSWARYTLTRTLANASTKMIGVSVFNPNTTAATWLLDHAQLEKNSVVTSYIDGGLDDGVWSGNAHASATYRVLRHNVSYDVRFTYTDADGVAGTNPYSTAVVTLVVPDNSLTTTGITLTPSETTIGVSVSYTGDDNQTATAQIQFKRTDLSAWSNVRTSFDRTLKKIVGTVADLVQGTTYDVRVTVTDTSNTVYGSNPISSSATTTVESLNSESTARVTFGGFVLSDGLVDWPFWVSEHDAFGHPDRRVQIQELARTDGAVKLTDFWGKRPVHLNGGVDGATVSELADNLAALRAALAPSEQRLVIDTLESTSYYLTGTCTSFSIKQSADEPSRRLLWDAVIECADPFRYAIDETEDTGITLTDGQTVAVNNAGALWCEPIFTITTTSVSNVTLTVTNTTTGDRIKPTLSITQGDVLVIDTTKLKLTKNGVEIDYEGGFPILAAGTNSVKVKLSTGSVTLAVRRRHRFL